MRDLPALLRAAERRVNANVWPNKNPGADSHLASIPANRDTDTDLLLIEAAARIEELQKAHDILDDIASYPMNLTLPESMRTRIKDYFGPGPVPIPFGSARETGAEHEG